MPKVLGWTKPRSSPSQGSAATEGPALLLVAGLTFVLVGGADIVLTLVPFNGGDTEWEFGTVTAALNALALPTLGLVFVALWTLQQGQARLLGAMKWLCWFFALVMVGVAFVYGFTVPIALGSTTDPLVGVGLRKAVARSTVQLAAYTVAYIIIGFQIRRAAAAIRPE